MYVVKLHTYICWLWFFLKTWYLFVNFCVRGGVQCSYDNIHDCAFRFDGGSPQAVGRVHPVRGGQEGEDQRLRHHVAREQRGDPGLPEVRLPDGQVHQQQEERRSREVGVAEMGLADSHLL